MGMNDILSPLPKAGVPRSTKRQCGCAALIAAFSLLTACATVPEP